MCLKNISFTHDQSTKKIVRILSFSKRKAHTQVLFTGLKILHLGQIYTCKVMIFMYKCVQQLLPNVFLDIFCRSYEVHQYNTRYLDLFRESSFKTELLRRTIKYTRVRLYNSFKPKIMGGSRGGPGGPDPPFWATL